MRILVFLGLWLVAWNASAAVYRCASAGGVVWTDRPCAADAAPAQLAPLGHVPAVKGLDLAREYDEREERSRRRYEKAGQAWQREVDRRRAEEARATAAAERRIMALRGNDRPAPRARGRPAKDARARRQDMETR